MQCSGHGGTHTRPAGLGSALSLEAFAVKGKETPVRLDAMQWWPGNITEGVLGAPRAGEEEAFQQFPSSHLSLSHFKSPASKTFLLGDLAQKQ